jgi:uncharacterized membrane protein
MIKLFKILGVTTLTCLLGVIVAYVEWYYQVPIDYVFILNFFLGTALGVVASVMCINIMER